MNKKGFLLAEETLKIVIAVISIGLLAFLLFSLYNNGKNAKDLEFAKESIDFLVQGINAESTLIDVYNPKGWNIGTWPHDVETGIAMFKTTQFQFPKSCSNLGWNKCICICKEDNAESCDGEGVCVNTEDKFQIDGGNIEIANPPITIKVDYKSKIISSA
ncbi:MAG: hypothetical protein AABX91_00325 [Nanoarchaeota archaeon]